MIVIADASPLHYLILLITLKFYNTSTVV